MELTFVCLCQKISLPSLPVLHSVFCLLVTPQTLDGQIFCGVNKQVIIIWCKVGTVWGDAWKFPTWIVNVLTLLIVLHTSPSFVVLHHRFQQSASEWIFLAFKNHITDCILQVLAFFIFVLIINDYSKWGKKLWHCAALHGTRVPFDTHRRWLIFKERAHVTCMSAVCDHFLFFGCTWYLMFTIVGNSDLKRMTCLCCLLIYFRLCQ